MSGRLGTSENDPLSVVRAAGRVSLNLQQRQHASERASAPPLTETFRSDRPRRPLPFIDPNDARRSYSPGRPGTSLPVKHLLRPKKVLPDMTMTGRPAAQLPAKSLQQWNRASLPPEFLAQRLGIPLSAAAARTLQGASSSKSLHAPPGPPTVPRGPPSSPPRLTARAPPPPPKAVPSSASLAGAQSRGGTAASRHAHFDTGPAPSAARSRLATPSAAQGPPDAPLELPTASWPPAPAPQPSPLSAAAHTHPPATAAFATDPAALNRALMHRGSVHFLQRPARVPTELHLRSTYDRDFAAGGAEGHRPPTGAPAPSRPSTSAFNGFANAAPATPRLEDPSRPDTGFSFFRGDSLDVSQLDRLPTVDLTRLSSPGPYAGLRLQAEAAQARASRGPSRGSGRSTPALARQAKPLVLSLVDPSESTPEVLEMELERMGPEELTAFFEKLRRKNLATRAPSASAMQVGVPGPSRGGVES